jgi:heparosan-N-sulfate-glucuronate 5-epimerase
MTTRSTLARMRFTPLHCSLEKPLGEYYQDFVPALQIVESGYHGTLDADGVPRVAYHGQGEFYNAITIAQYALANASAVIRGDSSRTGRLRVLCDWLATHQAVGEEGRGLWMMPFDNPKYPWLRGGWTSALAQGQGVSALLRGAELLTDDRYRDAARRAYDALHVRGRQPPMVYETSDELWYEEYPATPPLHVLNGHVYALFGILDVARALGDETARGQWYKGVRTVAARLQEFDLGYWSSYDLRTREPVDLHYHKNIHIPQLRILAALGGGAAFEDCALRWERYEASPSARIRLASLTRLRGLRRRLKRKPTLR